MKRLFGFGITMAIAIGLCAWAGIALFRQQLGEEGVRAVVMSAGVAFSVQMLTFGIARFFAPVNLLAGWGMGMLIRFLTLVFHGFVGAPLLGLPMGAALMSLAAFFFVSTLIEPFFLERPAPPSTPPSTTK